MTSWLFYFSLFLCTVLVFSLIHSSFLHSIRVWVSCAMYACMIIFMHKRRCNNTFNLPTADLKDGSTNGWIQYDGSFGTQPDNNVDNARQVASSVSLSCKSKFWLTTCHKWADGKPKDVLWTLEEISQFADCCASRRENWHKSSSDKY